MKPRITISGAGAAAGRLEALLRAPALHAALQRSAEAVRREAEALADEAARETGADRGAAQDWVAPAGEAAREEVRAIMRAGIARALKGHRDVEDGS